MAWNEPGNGNKDPWGNRGNDGPPDLDEVVRKMQQKLGGIFGGKDGSGDSKRPTQGSFGFGLIALIVVLVWMLSGIYIVEAPERGVVLRFGQYVTTTMPGPHWRFPYPIDRVEIVNVEEIRTTEIGYRSSSVANTSSIPSESLMLTKDENIIDLKIAVQYRIQDAAKYLFNVRNPDIILRQMMESAVRETVGRSDMDFVLTEGRGAIANNTEQLLQSMLDAHDTGLLVTSVNMQDVQPPEQVQAAFADVVKAREDEVRQINQAEAYANDILPKARGQAFRILQEAEAYKSQVVAKAEGDASRFTQVVQAFNKAPEVTTERLYLDAMESVYSRSQKVMIDLESEGSNVLYLPLDRLRGQSNNPTRINLDELNYTTSPGNNSSTSSSASRDDVRSRGGR
ncbi:MAG: FtsH protease activity modulator HflK [Methylophaga sp.]